MSIVLAWVLFPLILTVLAVGCGLLLEALLGLRLPGVLLPGVGLAVVIVVAQFLALGDATAELSTPVTTALAVAGFGFAWRRREPRIDWWPAAVAVAVLAVYAAPVVLSGQATFAGYIKLDDTATWMAFTDLAMDQGRSVAGLAPSTYEALLAINLGGGYPIGVFLPLGIGHQLAGQDVAWVIQPYMALSAAVLALALWSLATPLIASRRARAVAVLIAAQPALLVGYSLWGGVKEVVTAALIATAVAVVAFAARQSDLGARSAPSRTRFPDDAVRALVLLSVVCAGVLGTLGVGGGVWLVPAIVLGIAVVPRALGPVAALGRTAAFAALTVVLSIPVLAPGGLGFVTEEPLTAATEIGNLFAPLEIWQVAGVWPVGDFRLEPDDGVATYALIAVALGAAIGGLAYAVRARAWGVLTYVAGTLGACLVVLAFGSPWIDGKALAIASPAIPLGAVVFGGLLWSRGRRIVGGAVLAALAVGVLWSNALAYRDVSLAPRDQLAELESIGERIAGQGPTLMTEYQPYGVRHFLRDADPEGLSELRRRQIPLVTGETAAPQAYHDTDEIDRDALLVYRTLVLRRNPSQSRPPAPYAPIWRGRYYDVWQRAPEGGPQVIAHLGLGTEVDPVGEPACEDVMRLAREAGPDGTLAAVPRPNVIVVDLTDASHPPGWRTAPPSHLLPDTPGTIATAIEAPRPGRYSIWLGGSVRPRVDVTVNGTRVGSVRSQLNPAGQYVLLGEAPLSGGAHEITIRFHGADRHPGSGGAPDPIGPLVLSDFDPADADIAYVPSSEAGELCDRSWDWIEALGPGSG